MAITFQVRSQLFCQQQGTDPQLQQQASSDAPGTRVIRLPPTTKGKVDRPTRRCGTPWTTEEHDRFLKGLEIFPVGPWKEIAAYVGTRSARQTMTHAQKYREKIARNIRAAQASSSVIQSEQPSAQRKELQPPISVNKLETESRDHSGGVLDTSTQIELQEGVCGELSDTDHDMALFLSGIIFNEPNVEQV